MAMKKGLKITLIIVSVILVAAIVATLLVGKHYKDKYDRGENFDVLSYKIRNFDYENPEQFTPGNFTLESSITQIYIDWAYGKVDIQGYEGTEYRAEEDEKGLKDEQKLQWYCSGNVLYINYRTPGREVFKGDNFGKTLHFYIPDALMSTSLLIDVWTVSADIEADNLVIGDLDTVTVSGKTTVKNLNTFSGSFTSESGDQDIDLVCDNTDYVTTSGNVTIHYPEDRGFAAIFDSKSGKINSEFKFDSEYNSGGGIYKDDKFQLRVSTDSGNLNLKKSEEKK